MLYLPTYSPDLNPVERMGSKVKALVWKAKARSESALYEAIGEVLRAATARETANDFAAAGYAAGE